MYKRQIGGYSFVAYLSHLIIDRASLSRRSAVRTPNKRHLQHSGAHYAFLCTTYTRFAYVSPFLFRRLWPPFIYCRMAIVFSLLSGVPNFSMSYSSMSLISSITTRTPMGRATTFSFLSSLLLTPCVCLSGPHLSPYFLALFFPFFLPFLLLLSCTPQTYLWTISLLGFLLYPSIFSRLRYPILFQLGLSLLSLIQPYQLWLATFFGMFLA